MIIIVFILFINFLVAPEPDEIFKDLLKSKKHGQFLETYIKNNDPLLLFDSPITLKTPVPATSSKKCPSLLLYKLLGNNKNQLPEFQLSSPRLPKQRIIY